MSLVLSLAVFASPGIAQPRIHVHGSARIDAHASRAAGRLVLRGIVTDDAGVAMANDHVRVVLARAQAPDAPVELSGPMLPEACAMSPPGPEARNPLHVESPRVIVPTDDAGRFCMQVAVPVDRYVARIDWPGSRTVDPASAEASVDLALRSLSLSFSPEPDVVALDGPRPTVEAVAILADESATTSAPGIALEVTNEQGSPLGTGITNGSGRWALAIDQTRLGPPGRGELRLSFAGGADVAPSVHVAPIERRAHVVLRVPEAPDGSLPGASPEDGVTFTVTVTTVSGEPVGAGSVEALIGSSLVGAGPAAAGRAKVVATFAPPEAALAVLHLRYAPDAPWYVPGDEVTVTVPVRTSASWQRLLLVMTGLGVALWLALGRGARARALRSASPAPRRPLPSAEPRIEVVRSSRSARVGWTGRVIDAHDGTALAKARVVVERPRMDGVETLASAVANDAGRFELRCENTEPADELLVESPLHSALRKRLPPFGEIEIALVQRRRALLDRLVAWARSRGRPFDARPEPTPAQVRRAAGNDTAASRWADAVERVAFGPEPVDGPAEADVDRLAPSPDAKAPAGPATIVDNARPIAASGDSSPVPASGDPLPPNGGV